MAQHGIEINGGLALSELNHNSNGNPHSQYDNLTQLSFMPGNASSSWTKIMDINFQQSMSVLANKDRTLSLLHASFLCEYVDSDSVTTSSFILSLTFKYKSITPFNIIANVEVMPIAESIAGFNTRAILSYKNTGNVNIIENQVQCFVQIPFGGDKLRMNPLYIRTNASDPALINPVGDSYYFTNYQKYQGIFGVHVLDLPILNGDLLTGLNGFTVIDTNLYKSKNGYNIVKYANNKGGLALSNGWGCSFASGQFPSFVIANALSYSKIYNTFAFKNTMAQPTTPNATDIQLTFSIPDDSFTSGVHTLTLYAMCDTTIPKISFGMYNGSFVENTDSTISAETGSFIINSGLNLSKYVRKGTLTGTGNSIRMMLGMVPQNANLYFVVKIERGYRSTDYSVNPNDLTPATIPTVTTPVTITSPTYSIISMNQLLRFDCTSNAITVTLPIASTFVGQSITIRKLDSINLLTINPNGSDTINSYTTLIIQYKNSTVTFVSDGTNWNLD